MASRKPRLARAPRPTVRAVPTHRERAAPLLLRVGERVRAGRRARGRTLAQLALDCGLSRRFLTDLELGRANLSLQTLAQVAAALELEPSALLAAANGEHGERGRLVALAHALPDDTLTPAIAALEKLPRRARTKSARHF